MTLWLQILAVLLTAGGLAHQKFKNTEKPSITPDADYPDNIVENDRTKLINRTEWGFIIGGLMLGIISTVVAHHNSAIKEIEDKLATDRQISVATNSLLKLIEQLDYSDVELKELKEQSRQMRQQMAYMEHMTGEFDKLTVNIACELISTNQAVVKFLQRVTGLAVAEAGIIPPAAESY